MRIALIGASGFVGSHVLEEALSRGHQVTALARHPEKITLENTLLTKLKADVNNIEATTEVLKGHDAVISAYNPGWEREKIYQEFLDGYSAIQQAVKKSGIKRYIVIGGAGSLFVAPGVQLVDTPDFPAGFKAGALAAREYLNILQNEKDLEWTFLSPAIEMHPGTAGTRKGTYRVGKDNPVFDKIGRSVISVEDLSIAIVDEAEKAVHIRERFTVAW